MKKNMMFFAPEGDEGGGGEEKKSPGLSAFGPAVVSDGPQAGDLEVRAQNELEQKGQENEEGGKAPVRKEEKRTEESPALVDATALAEKFGAVIAASYPKQEENKPARKRYDEMSQEEREKELDLWQPTKEWQAKYDNLETREAALLEMRNGMTASAAKISKLRVDELKEELGADLATTKEFIRDMQNRASEERLVKAYPDLGKPELQPIIKGVSDQLIESGKKYKSEQELFGDLASGVEAVMHAAGVKNFKLSTGSSPANNKPKAKTNPNALPVLSSGAGGQAGGKTQESEKPRGIVVFEK